jgi:hypothetical protein
VIPDPTTSRRLRALALVLYALCSACAIVDVRSLL